MMEHGRNYDNDFTLTHRFQIFMRNMKSAEVLDNPIFLATQ